MLKGMFNLGKSENKRIKNVIRSVTEPETGTNVGKPIELAMRTIYPIIQTFVIRNEDFIAVEIFPIALLIEESDDEYVISLTDDEINPEEIIKMINPEEEHEKTVIILLRKCAM
jgi:hypothetical protein